MEPKPLRPSKIDALAASLRADILAGKYRQTGQLPRARDLMAERNIRSMATIHGAIRQLEAQGLLRVEHGKGIFVRHRDPIRRNLVDDLRLEHQRAVAGEAGEGLFEARTGVAPERVQVVVGYARRCADERLARMLNITAGAKLLVRTYTYLIDGKAHQIARSYLAVDLADKAGLTDPSVEKPGVGAVARLREIGLPIDEGTIEFEARLPTATEATELGIPQAAPVIEVSRIIRSGGKPVEVSISVVRADDVRYYLDVDLKGEPR